MSNFRFNHIVINLHKNTQKSLCATLKCWQSVSREQRGMWRRKENTQNTLRSICNCFILKTQVIFFLVHSHNPWPHDSTILLLHDSVELKISQCPEEPKGEGTLEHVFQRLGSFLCNGPYNYHLLEYYFMVMLWSENHWDPKIVYIFIQLFLLVF